ncbi:fused MFS/spermidine synthase [Aquimarina sp. MMG016]|uniref:spermidine synthase n=1 Tax=Aquimarina sp. MMG016 TaxID=2822690 RepID=UPI001B39DF3E|nr:fused MFS/spermidine synthase [Aquimarina sp. MMG016]MBQ4821637.1 fused MFS/spermidine synthase [Aquimarina sp. MMG016]
MKKIVSYIWPLTKKIQSKINGTLEITWMNGKKVLDSETANYSYGSLQRVLDYGLSKIYFDSKASILLLGMGGGSVIDTLRNRYNHRGHITAIEIDPIIIQLAKDEFYITENKNLKIIAEDAHRFVINCKNTYDLIIMDLFIDLKVPEEFYKIEFWDQLIKLMKPKGNVLFNAGIQLDDDSDLQSLIANYPKEIEFHLHDNVHGTNTLLIGRKK